MSMRTLVFKVPKSWLGHRNGEIHTILRRVLVIMTFGPLDELF